MTQIMLLYFTMLPILIAGDLLWVGFLASNFYNAHIAHLRGPVQWPGAILFYLIYTLGILIFVTYPHLNSLQQTILYGTLFGLVCYGVYNFTNHAVLNDWPMTVVVADVLWGIFLTTTVAVAGYYIAKVVL